MNRYEYEDHDPLASRQASTTEGRLTVHNIISSYHSGYDVLSESVQNAMDAIHLRWKEEPDSNYAPQIWIEIDQSANSLTVIDNGVGITPLECLSVFSPNYSLKSRLAAQGGRRLRGHKGVGATFLAYGFLRTELASRDGSGSLFTGRLIGGHTWAIGDDRDARRPLLNPYEETSAIFNSLDRGTLIRVQCGTGTKPAALNLYGTDILAWTGNLRSETAVGMIQDVVEPEFQPTVFVTLIKTDGTEERQEIECRYLFPHELGEDHQFIDMHEYTRSQFGPNIPRRYRNKEGIYRTYSDSEIRSEFEQLKEFFPEDRELWLYVFRAYGAKFFRDDEHGPLGRRVRSGVRLAADSMPIGSIQGISKLNRYTYSQNTVHVLLHVDGAEPDIGRKGFNEEVEDLGQFLAKELIERELRQWNDFLRSEVDERRSEAALEQWKFESRKLEENNPLPEWPGKVLRITSIPQQEQDVVALLHELLGSGAIIGYDVLSTSQHEKYDSLMWVRLTESEVSECTYGTKTCPWGLDPHIAERLTSDAVVEAVEYKHTLMSLVADFRNQKKSFSDVKLAIAWTAGDAYEKGVDDYPLEQLKFPRDLSQRLYPGQTHELLSADDDQVIAVILLDSLFESVQVE